MEARRIVLPPIRFDDQEFRGSGGRQGRGRNGRNNAGRRAGRGLARNNRRQAPIDDSGSEDSDANNQNNLDRYKIDSDFERESDDEGLPPIGTLDIAANPASFVPIAALGDENDKLTIYCSTRNTSIIRAL